MSAYKRRKLVKKIQSSFYFGYDAFYHVHWLQKLGFNDFKVRDIEQFVWDALFKYHRDEIDRMLGKKQDKGKGLVKKVRERA